MRKNKTKAEILFELEQAKQRIAELESARERDSEERFSRVFDASPAQMALTDLKTGQYVEVNEAFLQTLGFAREEVLGRTALELNLFSAPAQRAELLQRMGQQGYLRDEYVQVRAKSGELRHGIFSAEYLQSNGQTFLLTVMNDITEWRRAEERWQFALEGAGDGVWDWNPQTNQVFYSAQWKQMLGYEEDEIGNMLDEWASRVHPDDFAQTMEKVNAHLAGETPIYFSEHRLLCKDGTYKWILDRGKVIEWTEARKPLRVIGTHKDMTERKLSEKSAQENEARLQGILEATPDAMLMISPDGKILMANAQTESTFGYTREELLSMHVENLMPASLRPLHVEIRDRFMAHPRAVTTGVERNIFALRKNGETFPAEISLSYHQQTSGEVVVLCALRDVTEQKRAWELIAAQRDLARLNGASLPPEEVWYACLEVALRVSGLDCGGIYLLNEYAHAYELVHYRGISTKFAAQIFQFAEDSPNAQWFLTGKPHYFSEREICVQPAPAQEGIQAVAVLPLQYQAQILGCLTIASRSLSTIPDNTRVALETVAVEIGNILVQQQTEEALQTSRQQLSLTLRAARMGTWRWHIPTNRLEWSPEAAQIFGADFLSDDFRVIMERFHPEDKPRLIQALQESLIQKRLLQLEYRILDVEGKIVWITNFGHIESDAEGRPLMITGLVQDITERKHAEEELHLAEQRYRALIENAPDGIVLLGQDGKFNYASPSAEKLTGYSQAELQQMDPVAMTHPNEVALVLEELDHVLRNPSYTPTIQYRYQNRQGEWRWVESTYSNLLALSSVAAIIINFRDITERKLAEEALKRSQELLKEAQRIGQIGYMEWNRSTQALICSDEIYDIFGVSPDTPISKNLIDSMMKPGERERLKELDHQAIQQRMDMNYEYTIHTRRGKDRWVHQLGKTTYADDGKPIRMMMIVQDVTERKQAEVALRASEEKYRGLIESLDSIVATIDAQGTFLYINDLAAMNLGQHAHELIGKTMFEIFPEAYATQQMAAIRQVIQEDQAYVFESQSELQGALRWYRTSIQPIHDESGLVSHVLLNTTDIDNLKSIQHELETLNRTLEEKVNQRTTEVQDLYDNAPVGYYSLNADGMITAINQTALTWLGYPREELLGSLVTSMFATENPQAFFQDFEQFKITKTRSNLELMARRKDNTTFPVMLNAIAIYEENGQYISSRTTLTDITQLKLAENELKRNINFTNALLDAIPTPVFYKDRHGNYQGCNRAFTEIMGKTAEQVQGKSVYELWPGANAGIYHQKDLELMERGTQQVYEGTVYDKDGRDRPVIFVKDIFHDESGKVAGLVGAFIDITERKQAEDALRLANTEMERAIRLKDEFLASMSHELRTPLNAILGLSESLIEQIIGPLNERQLYSLQTIEQSGRHLLELINDILDLSKLESNQMTLDLAPVVVQEMCEASLIFIKEIARKKYLQVTFKPDPAVGYMQADGRRLKQMLVNLLSNAVKFTPEGGAIELQVIGNVIRRTVSFSVTDTGIGIASENLPRLFQPFVQLDSGLNRQFEGTGLGLALVASMAKLQGGKVSVESEPGRGSRFTITLPWTEPAASPVSAAELFPRPVPPPASAPAFSSGPLILIAEDNEANVITLSVYLQAMGYRVAIAHNGVEALNHARFKRPALILMDLQMPVLNGLEAIRHLRQDNEPQIAHIPVIALTALAMPADRERSLEAGADAYLSKPVNLKQLNELINHLVKEK